MFNVNISRSRTISKCSELSWLPSSSSSQVPSPKVSRANYWANYKVSIAPLTIICIFISPRE